MREEHPHLGDHRLLRRLAVGGMSEVFLAEEGPGRGLRREVVIKRMLPHLAREDRFREMFVREARTAARIRHPNVVQIYELGEADGVPYIAMELVPGATLRDVLAAARARGAAPPVAVAIDLAAQACAAAHAVHELTDPDGRPLGLVHRDLTPHNLMVTPAGFVKLLDFGIVKGARDERLTETGVLKGKLSYLAPEQIEQAAADRRADVFALGVVAWELLAGEKLFQGANEVAILRRILAGEVRPLAVARDDVPAAIEAVIARALSPEAKDRPATAEALRRALVEAAEAAGQPPRRDDTAAFVAPLLSIADQATPPDPVPTFSAGSARPLPAPPPDDPTRTATAVERRARALGALGLVALVAGGLALGLAAVALRASRPPVDDYAPPPGEPLPVVLAPVGDADEMRAELEPLRRHLERALGRPMPLAVAPTYAAAVDDLARAKADLAVVPAGVFARGRRVHPGLIPIAAKVIDGSLGSDGVILAREGAAADAPVLRGETVCYADPDSTTGHHLARAWLRDQGLDPDADVVARFSGNHLDVLRDLIDGRCAIGATFTASWTAADQVGIPVSRTRLVATTGWTPHDLIVVGPALPTAEREALREALLGFDPRRDLGVDRVGERERITGFAEVDEAAVDALDARLRAASGGLR